MKLPKNKVLGYKMAPIGVVLKIQPLKIAIFFQIL